MNEAHDFVEESLVTARPNAEPAAENDVPVTYTVLAATSQRGRKKLYDSNGFDYGVMRETVRGTYWRCSVRSKVNNCGVIIYQEGEMFTYRSQRHIHPGKVLFTSYKTLVSFIIVVVVVVAYNLEFKVKQDDVHLLQFLFFKQLLLSSVMKCEKLSNFKF